MKTRARKGEGIADGGIGQNLHGVDLPPILCSIRSFLMVSEMEETPVRLTALASCAG